MAKRITKAFRGACCAVALAALAATGATAPASADSSGMADPVISTQNTRTIIGERYIPGISISPDGCEIWVMDDGVEGYAVSRVTRDGRPVCRDINVCGTLNTDQYFATDSYKIYPQARARLRPFMWDARSSRTYPKSAFFFDFSSRVLQLTMSLLCPAKAMAEMLEAGVPYRGRQEGPPVRRHSSCKSLRYLSLKGTSNSARRRLF